MKYDHQLMIDDEAEVLASPRNSQAKVTKLEILYSNRDLVAINKPTGLLSIADGKSDKANKDLLKTRKIKNRILQKAQRNKPLIKRQKRRNILISKPVKDALVH